MGVTPIELSVWNRPFRKEKIRVGTRGYRSVEVSLFRERFAPLVILKRLVTFRWVRMLGFAPHTQHHVMLIRKHGGAGEWSPEDAEQR